MRSQAEPSRHGDKLCDLKVKARGTGREQTGVSAVYGERTGGLGEAVEGSLWVQRLRLRPVEWLYLVTVGWVY